MASRYPIDRDRITITGASMGGAATWYLASHYPDLFAAAAPFCGYDDYRLWEKPGGLTFHMREWEEPSWRARSAAFLVENLEHTAIWMVHGEWDRAVGGGVSVEHSRQMARLLGELGIPFTYTELPQTGHDSRQPEIWERVVLWLLDQRKVRDPGSRGTGDVLVATPASSWVAIEQLARYGGERALVDARFAADGRLDVQTDECPDADPRPGAGRDWPWRRQSMARRSVSLDLTMPRTFRREAAGAWEAALVRPSTEKRPGVSGPIGDLFIAGTILVPGTTGSAEETFFNDWAARDAATYYRTRNGGVHRGGIMGLNTVELPVIRDVDLAPEDRLGNNLILYGTPRRTRSSARAATPCRSRSRAPAWSSPAGPTPTPTRRVRDLPASGEPDRYVAVHGGGTPDAVTWGSHLDMALLPDYLVYARGTLLDWGFWGNDWRRQR